MGLTIMQAKVYLALHKLKKATAKAISKHSKVARQEAYRILAELHEEGLVEKIIATPTEYKAIPIEDCISTLIKRRKNEISETLKEATRLIQELKENNSKNTLQEDVTRFSLFSKQAAVRREGKMLENVQKSFDVVTSWRNLHCAKFFDREKIVKALQRGVKIRAIIDKPDEESLVSDTIEHLKGYSIFNIRYLPNAPKALMSIYDEKEAWVCTCTHPVLEECPTLWTNNSCLLLILQDHFEILWLTAMKEPSRSPQT
jgi:sugar-specific transcriptional regulator TrmB